MYFVSPKCPIHFQPAVNLDEKTIVTCARSRAALASSIRGCWELQTELEIANILIPSGLCSAARFSHKSKMNQNIIHFGAD